MFRPTNSSRKIIIDVAVAISLVSNKERQTKPLAKANAAKRKVAENKAHMPAGYDFKAVTFQASGGVSKDAQNILKQLPQRARST